LTNLLQERSVESNNEKKALREFLSRLEQEKGLVEESSKAKEKDFSSYRIGKTSRPLTVQDYFIRLKTTSVSADKYAETLDLLQDLYRNEQLESQKMGTKLLSDSLSVQIKIPENYKVLVKALASKNTRVLNTAFKFLKEIGELEDRAADFVTFEGS
jgi:5'-3' exonuclease